MKTLLLKLKIFFLSLLSIIDRLFEKIATIPNDKLLHFFMGYWLFMLYRICFDNVFSLGIVLLLAILKELYDKYIKKTNLDSADIFFTLLPGLVLTLFNLI